MLMYFQVLLIDDDKLGVAVTRKKSNFFTLPYQGMVENWTQLELELQDGEYADYIASNLGCRLCSKKLRDILINEASPKDFIQWLPVQIFYNGKPQEYSILHFPHPPDILNKSKSILVEDFVVKPVLSTDSVAEYNVASYPKAGEMKLFISESVKDAIVAAGCTGLELSPAAMG